MYDNIDKLSVNTIRTLSMDAIEKAGTGHPGIAIGAAPMIYSLWTDHMNINPKDSKWFNRDRFVLSAGHGSILLYTMLHLSGYDVSMEDIKNFRVLNSKLPGHPEFRHTDGVEATTGPLGQGVANGVGMAMAEAHLAKMFNKEDMNIVDHYTYVLCSDGDLQEGISHEACSLAGHLGLNKLIMLYDSNDIQLDGPLNMAYGDDVKKRFKSYNWDYQIVKDGNDMEEISKAIEKAKKSDKPSIIEIKTIIGYGSPNQGTSRVHGAPLGEENIRKTKEAYGWEYDKFVVPEEVYERFNEKIIDEGKKKEEAWNNSLEEYIEKYPEDGELLKLVIEDKLVEDWDKDLTLYDEGESIATRNVSGNVINELAERIPTLWGGSADLSGSNKTNIKESSDFSKEDRLGRNINFGVREHAMGGIINGILYHGGTRPFGATFLVFSDYVRPAIRVAALSKIPAIYVFTHDSIAVGADGPTHEPIEQIASFRAMPNVNVIRPADANEVVAAWEFALNSKETPTLLALTRQNVPTLKATKEMARENLKKGAYIVSNFEEKHDGILIASGSEVSLAIEAQKSLKEKGIDVSVVSMPSMDLFDQQSDEYKESILPKDIKKRLALEMGSSFGWDRYVGDNGKVHAIDRFGASGDEKDVIDFFGFNVDTVVNEFLSL